jgi:phage-related protein
MPQTAVLVFRSHPDPAPFIEWLKVLEKRERKAYAKCLALIEALEREGFTLQFPTAKKLRDDIYELRTRVRSVHYRILYFFCGNNLACVSHGLTKEDVVPPAEISRAIRRKNLVANDRNRFTQEWECPA